MSSQVRRIGVEVYGNVSGYIGATNRVVYGTTRMAQGFKSAIGVSRLLDNQMKAIGTTARYALAGSVVFGITGALSRLQDFENELGTINSLAGKLNSQGKFIGLGRQLQDIGSEAIKMSDKYGAAVTDVESYVARFYSTFDPQGNVKRRTQEMEGFTAAILQLQTALGSEAGDPGALAAGIGGLVNVIPGGRKDIAKTTKRVANLVAYLTQVTPNVTGTDVANASGRLASIYNVANMSPEQLFAVFGQAAKVGGTPTIVTRGVTQLLGASLLNPKTPSNLAAYQAAGLSTDPSTLHRMGGFRVLEQLMRAVAPNGLNLSKDQLKAINNQAPGAVYNNPALKGQLNLTLLYKLFGRQQSVQQFVNILSQDGIRGLQNYIKAQERATKADLNRQRADEALRSKGIQVAQTAISNIGVSLVRGLNAPMTVFGRLLSKTSDELAAHRTTTSVVEAGGATLLATRLIGKLPMFRTIGKGWAADAEKMASGELSLGLGTRVFRKVIGGVAGLGNLQTAAARAAIMTEESAAVAAGGAADGSRARPFWVILSPWSGTLGGLNQPGTNPHAPGSKTPMPPVFGIPKVLGRYGKYAGRAAEVGTVAAIGGGVVKGAIKGGDPEKGKASWWDVVNPVAFGENMGQHFRLLGKYAGLFDGGKATVNPMARGRFTPGTFSFGGAAGQVRMVNGHPIWFPTASKGVGNSEAGRDIYRALAAAQLRPNQVRDIAVTGHAKADLTIKLVDKNGRQILVHEKKGVPIEITNDTVPHAQGRAGVRRSR